MNSNHMHDNLITEYQRSNTKKNLSMVLSSQKNIDIFERYIFNSSKSLIEYKQNLYNVMFEINSGNDIKTILEKYNNGLVLFNKPIFKEIKEINMEEQKFLEKPFEVDEGVLECQACGSKRTYSFSKQTRGGDEGTTVFAKCAECGKTWKT